MINQFTDPYRRQLMENIYGAWIRQKAHPVNAMHSTLRSIIIALPAVLFQSPHNDIRYMITSSEKALEFFLINEITGQIYIKKPLSEDDPDTTSYTVRITVVFIPTGTRLNFKTIFPGMGIPVIKITRSWDCLFFIMLIRTLVKRHRYCDGSEAQGAFSTW